MSLPPSRPSLAAALAFAASLTLGLPTASARTDGAEAPGRIPGPGEPDAGGPPAIEMPDLPELGEVDRDWFAPNPYAADSATHAYVIEHFRDDAVRLREGGGADLRIVDRTVVRIVDARGLGEATVRLRMYAPKGSLSTQVVESVRGFTYTLDEDAGLRRTALDDAQVFTTRLDDDFVEVAFSLPAVAPGSVLDYEVRRRSDFISRPPTAYLQGALPVRHAAYRFRSAPRFGYQSVQLGTHALAAEMDEGRAAGKGVSEREAEFRFELAEAPAIREEAFVTTLSNYAARVEMSLGRFVNGTGGIEDHLSTWDAIADGLREAPLLRAAMKPAKAFATWAEAYDGPGDDAARVRWALTQVAERLRWNDYTATYSDERPRRLLDVGTGTSMELNAVLLGLTRALGVGAYPVYLKTRERGYLYRDYPAASRLTTMIVGIGAEEGAVELVDATDPTSELGIVPLANLNGEGLMVGPRWHRFVPLQDKVVAQRTLRADLALDPEGYLSGALTLTLRDYAAYPHTRLRDGATVLDTAALASLPGYAVSEVSAERDRGYAWVVRARVRSEQPALDLGGELAFPLSIGSNWVETPFAAASRTFPVEFAHALAETREVSVTLPEGYAVADVPESLSIATPDRRASYRFAATSEDGRLVANSALLVRRLTYAPEEYAGLRDIFARVADREGALASAAPE